ncbi:MAG: efflux RND transporter periplasmic adaptor subunit [Acidobacteriota bacterium]
MIWITMAAAAGLMACGHKVERRDPGPPVTVRVSEAAPRLMPAGETYTGSVKSRRAVTISTKMMGRVLRLHVEEGQSVRKGQPLVDVDAAEAQSAYEQAQAGLRAAEVAAANARRDLERFTSLRAEKAVTEHQLEQVKAGAAAAEAQKAQAEANLKMAGTLLSYGRITAPSDGIITRRWLDSGNLAYPGAPLLTLEDPSDLEIGVAVPEERSRLLAPDQAADVRVDGFPQPFRGTLTSVVPAADPMSRTSSVKVAVPPGTSLRPGQFARVRFDALAEKVLAVPEEALLTQGQMDGVFVVEQGLARLRWIQTGQREGGFVQVLSGLSAGERVIAPVPAGLQDGTPVEVAP